MSKISMYDVVAKIISNGFRLARLTSWNHDKGSNGMKLKYVM